MDGRHVPLVKVIMLKVKRLKVWYPNAVSF